MCAGFQIARLQHCRDLPAGLGCLTIDASAKTHDALFVSKNLGPGLANVELTNIDDDKHQLLPLLRQAYKNRANDSVPLTFALPADLALFEQYVAQCRAEGTDGGMWMLTTVWRQLGTDLVLKTAEDALEEARRPRQVHYLRLWSTASGLAHSQWAPIYRQHHDPGGRLGPAIHCNTCGFLFFSPGDASSLSDLPGWFIAIYVASFLGW